MHATARTALAVALALLCSAPATPIADQATRPLQRRLRAVRAMFSSAPKGLERHFSARFLRLVPAAHLKAGFTGQLKAHGAVVETRQLKARGPHFAEYWFLTQTHAYPVKLGVEPRPPHRINTLWYGGATPRHRSYSALLLALKKLPGQVSLAVWRLGHKPRPVLQLNPDLPLAVGSTFKLYILGALLEQIAAGQRSWQQTVGLRRAWRSFPSGVLQGWPEGAPISLASLTGQMLSISDNTATDHLLFLLGRDQVQRQQARMGHRRPALNQPLLSTREMFMLKRTSGAGPRIRRYLPLAPRARRAYLERRIARLAPSAFLGIDRRRPTAIDKVEWFASAADLCRALDWLRRRTAKPATRLGRALLAINPGMRWSEERAGYVGFKGGSEPGVINLSWLVRLRSGGWHAVSLSWNDPRKPLATKRFNALAQSLILLVEAEGWGPRRR